MNNQHLTIPGTFRKAALVLLLTTSMAGFSNLASAQTTSDNIYTAARTADLLNQGKFTEAEREIILRGITGNQPVYSSRSRDREDRGDNEGDDEDGGGHGHGHGHGKGKSKHLPPGLQKKLARGGQLPPGWQRKFQRGEVVDSSVWSQRTAIPSTVDRQLRDIANTEIVRIGDKVARVDSQTRLILDVINVLGGQ